MDRQPCPRQPLRSASARRALTDSRIARLLVQLRDFQLYRRLGFVRLSDYVEERLGMGARTAQELMRTEEALGALPLAAAAYEAGAITASHVRILTRVATEQNEKELVLLASRTGVRRFEALVILRDSACGGSENSPVEDDAHRAVGIRISVPAWVSILWRDTVAMVRRLIGRHAPPGVCLEMVLGEFASALPGEALGESDSEGFEGTSIEAPDADGEPCVIQRERSAGGTDDRGDPGRPPHSRDLDRDLRRLVAQRQRHEAALSEHLLRIAEGRRYILDGYESMEAFAKDRCGFSARHLYSLLALARTLRRLPLIREAFLSGGLTLRKVVLIGKVASDATEVAWIDRARTVTLRRLEDEIIFWRMLRECRPAVWRRLKGGPVPDRISLVPGHPARVADGPSTTDLHGSALSAEALIRALESDEALDPLPGKVCSLRLHVEARVSDLWKEIVAGCRKTIREDLSPGDVLALALADFWRTWDNEETRRQRRRNRTLERDGWRCTAPGCRSIGSGQLQEHHVVFRVTGGGDSQSNLTTVCSAHHLGIHHQGWIRCSGEAPDQLRWEFGGMIFDNERLRG